jgi:DNA repair protein RadC
MEDLHKPSTSIKHWAADDRPREKMIQKGANHLSTVELLAILIHNGTRTRSAIDLSRELLQLSNHSVQQLARMSLSEIQQVKGIGPAKAVTIKAALQLAFEKEKEKMPLGQVIRQSEDMVDYLKQQIGAEVCEHFVAVYLNRRSKLIRVETLSIGGTTATIVDPRIVLKHAIELQASYIILCHNHPSGSTRPSHEDRNLTRRLKEAAQLFDITVLDHLIVTTDSHFSFAAEGEL